MLKNIFLYLKFYYDKIFTSKYKIEGKCNGCGACCKNIVFLIKENYVTTKEQFEELKNFDKKYHHFEISGRNEKGALLFKCKSLDDNNRCRDYFFRSVYCRAYPNVTGKIRLGGYETFDSCGYKIKVDKNFNEYLR